VSSNTSLPLDLLFLLFFDTQGALVVNLML